jgi:class 3 adenylate cyclase
MAKPTVAELQELGLYDPAAADAEQRLELLEFLISTGASAEDLLAYRDELPGLPFLLAMRGGSALTLQDAVERTGIGEDKLLRFIRAAGFPQPAPADRAFTAQFVDLVGGVIAAEQVFGEVAVLQLVRVMGSAMARLADALVSAFLVNVEPAARGQDAVGLGVARANADAAALMPLVGVGLDGFLRQHLIGARRTILGDTGDSGYETRQMCVGFIDLVGSTALAQRLSTRELGAVLTKFEHVATDAVTSAGGRVVKLIGDEVLYTVSEERQACAIALALAAAFAEHETVPPVRAGVAGGEVMMRDGDVFGPVVNLAARAVKVAGAGEVVAPAAVATAAGVRAEPLGPQQLKGIWDGVELYRLLPLGGRPPLS